MRTLWLLAPLVTSLVFGLPAVATDGIAVRLNGRLTSAEARELGGVTYVPLRDVAGLFGGKAELKNGEVLLTNLLAPPITGPSAMRSPADQWIAVDGSRGMMFVRAPIVDDPKFSLELRIKPGYFEQHDGPITCNFLVTLYDRGKSPMERQNASVDGVADSGGTYSLQCSSSNLDQARFFSVSLASSWFPNGLSSAQYSDQPNPRVSNGRQRAGTTNKLQVLPRVLN